MRFYLSLVFALVMLSDHQCCNAAVAATESSETTSRGVPGDRWMEIDLYWFDREHVQQSVADFWDRFAPMYRDVQGDRGVILNVGWTVGYIMEWSGDAQQMITLPQGSGQQPWVSETLPLSGDTTTRMREWKERFAKPTMVAKSGYGRWTYGELRDLADALRSVGVAHGVERFKVGTLVYAWEEAYGEVAPWVAKHPESFSARVPRVPGRVYMHADHFFDPANSLHADKTHYACYPDGYPEGTRVCSAFAEQWGSLSKFAGLDALMLRDSFGFMEPYYRRGRLGELMPSPKDIEQTTQSVSDLVRQTKQANSNALVMMYSNAASAVGDWRCNGCDLERIAKEGFLDVFVDQTWAGAWNEVGTRHNHFWNSPTLGWTYQLMYTLIHGAMLADTKVRRYPLIETFDAWESWDVLHTVPQRLRWGIWAYSHAAVKTPHGISMPQGSYISWANQGKRLLSAEDVQFLSSNIGEAVKDAARTVEVAGPTIVYCRSAQQWQIDHATPTSDSKAWIDEQAGSIAKWPLPISSITRIEWLKQVATDLPIVQAPSHLTDEENAALHTYIDSGRPIAMFGSFADGVDAHFLAIAGIKHSTSSGPDESIHQAINNAKSGPLHDDFPAEFPVQVALNRTTVDDSSSSNASYEVVYSVDGNPELILTGSSKKLLLWDPPDFRGGSDKSLKDIWGGSVVPYSMTAAAVNSLLRAEGKLHVERVRSEQSGTLGAWQTSDGKAHLLIGNLEEGLRDDADQSRHFTLQLPDQWPPKWKDAWNQNTETAANHNSLKIDLRPFASELLEAK